MAEENSETTQSGINTGYTVFRIAKALATAREHDDPEVRSRAMRKIEKWVRVLDGMNSGQLDVGSRTPVGQTPAWVTLEVVTGGFATGSKLADGPLQEHERGLLSRLAPSAGEIDARRLLNAYYLSDEGLAELEERLKSGCFDVAVPEEGALLVVAWLTRRGHVEEAQALLEEISSQLPELRFFPIPTERARQFGSQVSVWNVGEISDALKALRPNRQILAQKDAIEVWLPLYDRMVGLFLETVEGGPPFLQRDEGTVKAGPHGRFPVAGGWPCRRYPERMAGTGTGGSRRNRATAWAKYAVWFCGAPEGAVPTAP